MTAEIGVLNRLGVALAADSAVSIGPKADKIYTSAEKLFQLVPPAPVGVMIYNSATHVDMPWETIFKAYRSSRFGKRRYATLRQYAESVLSFLRGNTRLLSAKQQDADIAGLVQDEYARLLDRGLKVCQDLVDRKKGKGGITTAEALDIFRFVWSKRLGSLRKHAMLPTLRGLDRREVRRRLGKAIRDKQNRIYAKLPLGDGDRRTLDSVAIEFLFRDCMGERHAGGDRHTGVVFAGFGEDEFYPSLVCFTIDGMLLGRPRAAWRQENSIGDSFSATVVPFAQDDMVRVFMEGIDANLREAMEASVDSVVRNIVTEVVNVVTVMDKKKGAAFARQGDAVVRTVMDNLKTGWSELGQAFWDPVMSMVNVLPKDELAAMAESLVNMTKFKRRVTTERETVGGPIDVALITKGDGFVWIKRKHYFDAALNPRAMARLLDGGGNGR